jgi:hypothetical protein
MAPEQARGERTVEAAADIFSLGCVIHECLSGAPPFTAGHISAVLAKILFATPAPLLSPLGTIPTVFSRLVLSMLEKDAARRPRNAGAVLARLEELNGSHSSGQHDDPSVLRANLADDEQRLLCVIVATPISPMTETETLAPQDARQRAADIEGLRTELALQGAQLETLADESLIVALKPGQGCTTEHVARSLQCALLLRERCTDALIALATGLGVMGAGMPVGEAIDRAGQMLRCRLAEPHPDCGQIVLDEASAGLLGGRYAVKRVGSFYTLDGEGRGSDATRPLLGRPTPCVGREPELAILESALCSCIEEGIPRAVLITAPPGLGKSRLQHEFLRRLEQRGQRVLVCSAGCEPLSAGAPYGPLARALRQLCKIKDGESLAAKRDKLCQRVAEHLPPDEAHKTAELLCELCGLRFSDDVSLKLRAHRHDPRGVADLVTQALLRFLRAECAVRPVLLVLEDLQWGDARTIKLIGSALHELTGSPLLVVATARPNIHERFGPLWPGRMQLLPLRPLSNKASERMARQLLHNTISPQVVARIVARAAGNPLWLEELIRKAAEGNTDETPQTILAMLQARIGQLAAGDRQVLRAASIFGETFWEGGIQALLGRQRSDELAQHLDTLIQRELMAVHTDSRFPGQRELRFRHTLMRDAAYSLLTEDDRCLGHRLAGAFLEAQGESDLAVLAEHAWRGQELARAAQYYARAAESALHDNDATAALRYAQAGLSCNPEGEVLDLLRCIRALEGVPAAMNAESASRECSCRAP